MTPIAHMRGNGRPGLVKLHRQATRHKMSRSCKTNRAAANDRDRQRRSSGTHAGTFVFVLRVASFRGTSGGSAFGNTATTILGKEPQQRIHASKRAA